MKNKAGNEGQRNVKKRALDRGLGEGGAGNRSLLSGCLIDDTFENDIQFFRHLIQRRHLVCTEDVARQAVGQPGFSVRLLGDVKSERRFNAGSFAGFQHANGEMGIEDHHHPVTGNFHADGLGAASDAGVANDAHFLAQMALVSFLMNASNGCPVSMTLVPEGVVFPAWTGRANTTIKQLGKFRRIARLRIRVKI